MEQAIGLLDDQRIRNETKFCEHDDEEEAISTVQKKKHQARWRAAGFRTLSMLRQLLPSYFHAHQGANGELHPTAYLDALRGYAAVIVFIYHAFGLPNIWFFQLPIIRVFFDGGSGMVAIFFVISGYVLSYRMIKMIRTQQAARLHDSLASSTFRRFIRLYGSTGVATFIAALMVSLRWYVPYGFTPKETFLAQMGDWFFDFVVSSDPFADIRGWVDEGVFHTHYLDQMWTIPVEYRGSIVLFVLCTASSKLSTASRWTFLWTVVVLSYYWRAVYVAEFLFGMFIAELSLVRHPDRLGSPSPSACASASRPPRLPDVDVESEGDEKQFLDAHRPRRGFSSSAAFAFALAHVRAIGSRIGYVVLLMLAMVLLGQPDAGHTPDLGASNGQFPWPYLASLIPPWYGEAAYTFWPSIGAFLLVLSLDSCRMLQRPFEWRFSQYLGDLSFGIYAMHWPFVWGFYRTVVEPWRIVHLGDSHLAHFPGALLITVIVLFVADYFTRVDRLVVRSARWVQNKTFIKWE